MTAGEMPDHWRALDRRSAMLSPMTMQSVGALFGADAVKLALAEPDYADIDGELLAKLERLNASGGPGFVRSWALSEPWPVFCAIVRVLSGEHERIESMPRCAFEGDRARCGRFPFTATTYMERVTCPDCLAGRGPASPA